MIALIDQQCRTHRGESIRRQLPITPSTYCWHGERQADPTRRSARARRNDELRDEIQRVWDEQY